MASKETPQINASSQADIAFLLLVFFLVTTTMDVDKGLQRRLPPIQEKIVEFITNPANDPNLPERETINVKGFGNYAVSKGVVSLQNDRGTSYNAYIQVQNEIVRAFNEVRDSFAMQNYGKKYAALDEDHQKIVRDAIPQNISEAEPRDVKGK